MKKIQAQITFSTNTTLPSYPKIVFMFAGQGLEWVGMGRQLYATEPVFRQVIDACEQALSSYVTWSLTEELHRDTPESRFRKEVVQPTLFAVEVALAALWRSYGVEPQAVIGHSMGEIAAAYIAGALSLDDATRLICKYDEIIEQIRGQGVMGVASLSAAEAAALVAPFVGELYVGIHNTPNSTVLSGKMAALSQAFEQLQAQGIFCRQINIDFAAHSPLIDPIVPNLQAAFAPIHSKKSVIPVYSVVTKSVTNGLDLGADYWARVIQQPNYFSEMIEQLLDDGFTTFIEVGPHPILSKFAEEICTIRGTERQVLHSLYRDKDEMAEFLQNVAKLSIAGFSINRPTVPAWDRYLTNIEQALSASPEPDSLSSEQTPFPEQQHIGANYLATLIENTIKNLLSLPIHTPIAQSQGFFEMGLDSLASVSLRNELAAQLGVSLPTTVALEYPTIAALTKYIRQDVLGLDGDEQNATQEERASRVPDNAVNEPIAIIGMACRFPGNADSPEAFWELLQRGGDGIAEVPSDRWDVDAYYDPEPGTPGKIYTRRGGFIGAVDGFDATFFQIAPREATYMDPQQRLLMEVSWEALENAGCPPERMKGKAAGVFIGMSTDDYALNTLNQSNASEIDVYTNTGVTRSVSAGRLAYTFGWQGPAMQVDTACSSSLVAVHLACQSLRSGESELALVGGVNLILSPQMSIGFCRLNALSPDGICRAFDADANGYVRSEGCGVIILKRLSDAIADGDNVLSVIHGSAINHDGASSGLTVPNGQSQQALLRQALRNATLSPADISYVEAHGTGTPLGDPIEVRALSAVFCKERSDDNALMLGSVKTNIGHLEAAAGIAGIIKVVLSLQHKQIPPHLHLNQLNPSVEWETLPLLIPTSPTEWETSHGPGTRIAGVSSFGMSGTNAHILIAESPVVQEGSAKVTADHRYHLLTLSAKNEQALLDLTQAYRRFLNGYPDVRLGDVCYTSHAGRSHFNHRLSVVAQSAADMQTKLAKLDTNSIVSNQPHQKVAFLFTGQGSQYIGMGREFYETEPTFRKILNHCNERYQQMTGQSLLDALYPADLQPATCDLLNHTTHTQPALFALEVALAELWLSWGIQPDMLIGHSIGEIVAACIAGVFSLEDGLKLVEARGRLMGELPQNGEMVSFIADEKMVRAAIVPYANDVSIAAINGPESVVISGKRESVQEIAQQLAAQGIKMRQLAVSHAFHSPLMDPMLAEFRQVAQGIVYHKPTMGLVSNVTGQVADDEIMTADYWVRHVRETVRFADGVATLHKQGIAIFVEIGPNATLSGMAGQVNREQFIVDSGSTTPLHLPSLRESQSDWQQILTSLGQLYLHGVEIDWAGFDKGYEWRKVALPTYPFQRQRYWVDTMGQKTQTVSLRPLVDRKMHLPRQKQIIFEKIFSIETLPFLADHLVFDEVVVPGACYLSVALSGADLMFDGATCMLQDVIFPQALPLLAGDRQTVQLVVERQTTNNGAYAFQIVSFAEHEQDSVGEIEAESLLHATGRIVPIDKNNDVHILPGSILLHDLQDRCQTHIDANDLYQTIEASQVHHGTTFRWFAGLWQNESGEALAQMQIPDAVLSTQGYPLYPGLVDACFQVVFAANMGRVKDETGITKLPFAIESLTLYTQTDHKNLWCYAKQTTSSDDEAGRESDEPAWDITLLTNTGQVVAQIIRFQTRTVPATAIFRERLRTDWLYTLAWMPSQLAESSHIPVEQPDCWLLFGDSGDLSQQLVASLTNSTIPTVLVTSGTKFVLSEPTASTTPRLATIDPNAPSMFRQLMTVIDNQYQSVGVAYLWGLRDDEPSNAMPETSFTLCAGLLHLAQALIGNSFSTRLWVVTRGGHKTGDPAAGALWGLGRTIAQEQPRLHCTCVDLDAAMNTDVEVVSLCHALFVTNENHEPEVLYQDGIRHCGTLVPWQTHTTQDKFEIALVNPQAVYLITGGLGALGLQVAQQLIADGARHLVLTSRRGVTTDEQRTMMTQFQEQGAEIVVVEADISEQDDVLALIDRCTQIAPLRGIIHAAGLLDDGVLTTQTRDRFKTVMRPKVHGSWHLHSATQQLNLDFFVCFSSIASLMGSAGQSNYAAANGFMDALMQQRRQMGLSGLSINWGPWDEVGMAADLGKKLQSQGMSMITPGQGRQLLRYLLQHTMNEVSGTVPSQIGVIPTQRAYRQQTTQASTVQDIYDILHELPSDEQIPHLTKYLRTKLANILGLSDDSAIYNNTRFFDFGLDSLMAVELKNTLERDFGRTLRSTLLFDYPTLTSLTPYLLSRVLDLTGKPTENSTPEQTQIVTRSMIESAEQSDLLEIEQLSEDDLLSLINQKVESIL